MLGHYKLPYETVVSWSWCIGSIRAWNHGMDIWRVFLQSCPTCSKLEFTNLKASSLGAMLSGLLNYVCCTNILSCPFLSYAAQLGIHCLLMTNCFIQSTFSCQFGFLKLDSPEEASKKTLLTKVFAGRLKMSIWYTFCVLHSTTANWYFKN